MNVHGQDNPILGPVASRAGWIPRKPLVDCSKDPFNPACCVMGPDGTLCPVPPIKPDPGWRWDKTWKQLLDPEWRELQKKIDVKKQYLAEVHGAGTAEYYSEVAKTYSEYELPLQEVYARHEALVNSTDSQQRPILLGAMAVALEKVGSYRAAASYYAYLESQADEPSDKMACIESQIACLQSHYQILSS